MRRSFSRHLAGAWLLASAVSADAQGANLSWTDWADLALASPVVIVGTIADVERLGRKEAPDVPPGQVRALVEATLTAALKAPSVLPQGAAWLWQGATDARGRPPFKEPLPVIVFASPMSGGGNPSVQALRLTAPHAQQPWSAESEQTVRSILTQALQPAAQGLMVTGVKDAFRTSGDVPGASESQFFLSTEGGRPITLIVKRRPDSAPRVLAATGELVDRAAPVTKQTLLWRGLACGMPAALPHALAEDGELAADYSLARTAIGACGRTKTPPG